MGECWMEGKSLEDVASAARRRCPGQGMGCVQASADGENRGIFRTVARLNTGWGGNILRDVRSAS